MQKAWVFVHITFCCARHTPVLFRRNAVDIKRSAIVLTDISCCVLQEHFLLAWVNLALFDYRRQLLSGKKKLTLWPVPKGQYPNEKLCPLEPVGKCWELTLW